MAQQKRVHERKSLCYRAMILAADGSWKYECDIFDVSVGGAKLGVYCPPKTSLPDRFILRLSKVGSSTRLCQVAWRRGHEMGVRFVRAKPPAFRPQMETTEEQESPARQP